MYPVISQDAYDLHLAWVQGDPINLGFRVKNVDWSGAYTSHVKNRTTDVTPLLTFIVTATYVVGPEFPYTEFVLSASAVDSAAVGGTETRPPYKWDLQQAGGRTRFAGECKVRSQVTV